MEPGRQAHWQGVYTTKPADTVSWFQPSPAPSLRLIEASGLKPPARVVDIGGGASALVDALLERGFRPTVLDIAEAALEVSRARLGGKAESVTWTAADITRWTPPGTFSLWHDRAVFHFLTEAEDRRCYRAALETGLEPGGFLAIATFAKDGPEKCSGLPVQRYDAEDLAAEFGPGFELIQTARETHQTPWGSPQSFTWALFRRS